MNSSTFFSGFGFVDVQPATVVGDLPQCPVRREVEDVALLLDDLLFVRGGAVRVAVPSRAIARGRRPENTFPGWMNCAA